jgi:hypothetical protein
MHSRGRGPHSTPNDDLREITVVSNEGERDSAFVCVYVVLLFISHGRMENTKRQATASFLYSLAPFQ